MFDLGMQEILIVLVVALVFIGPKRLPEIARTLGRAFIELRRAGEELKGQIDLAEIIKEEPPSSGDRPEPQTEAGKEGAGSSSSQSSDQQERGPKDNHEAQTEASQKTET